MSVMPPSDRLIALRELQLARDARPTPALARRAVLPLPPAHDLRCPKCDATMNLTRLVQRPSGLEIRTFDCTGCDHAHIVTSAPDLAKETGRPNDIAADALEEARGMAPGAQRSEALKKAGLLRRIADNHGLVSPQAGLWKHNR